MGPPSRSWGPIKEGLVIQSYLAHHAGSWLGNSYSSPVARIVKIRGHSMFLGGGAPAETFSNQSLYYSNLIIAHIQAKTSNWGPDCPRIGRVDGVEN